MATNTAPDRIRYGVIGTGMMGGEHLLNLASIPDAEIVAISDPNGESLEWGLAGAGGVGVGVHRDHRELLERSDLDAVVIASPNMTHVDVLADTLRTDLAVMVEKPMCTTIADSLTVSGWARDRWEQRRALTWVGLEYRYMPTVSRFVAALDAGGVGRLRMISIREHRFPFLTKVDNWNRFNSNTGGTLVEKCCHFFDLMCLVAGSKPVRVLASGGQDVNHLDESYVLPDGSVARPDILDNAFVIVEFANGVRGLLDLCMFAEGGRYEQELVAVGDRAKVEATVPGDTVRISPRDGSGTVELPAPMPTGVAYEGFHHGASYLEHLAFIEALRSGSPATVGVDQGLWSVAVGEAAHCSIDEGRPVLLAELGLE